MITCDVCDASVERLPLAIITCINIFDNRHDAEGRLDDPLCNVEGCCYNDDRDPSRDNERK